MCPACLATASLIALSLGSTGGLAAVAVKLIVTKPSEIQASKPAPREDRHVQHHR